MGVLLGSAVVPIALCVTWKKASKMGCIVGAVFGLVCGIIAWLVTTAKLNPGIDVVSSGGDYEMLAGNLAAIGVGGIISTVWSYIKPDDFNFDVTRAINSPHYDLKDVIEPSTDARAPSDTDSKNEKEPKETVTPAHDHVTVRAGVTDEKDLDPVALNKAFKFAAWSSVALTIIMIILIPLPLFFASTIYDVGSLKAWVIVAIIWAFLASFTVVLYPLWESRVALTMVSKGIIKDIFHPGSGKHVPPTDKPPA